MILITGGMGFIGLHIAYDLAERGKRVLLLSRRAVGPPSFLASYWDKNVKCVPGDILDLPNLLSIIKEYSVESIIHAAAVWEGGGNLHQVLRTNLEGTMNILEAARIMNLRRVSFVSSTFVYLGSKSKLVTEDINLPVQLTKFRPFVPATKKAGEQICLLYAREYEMNVPILRVSRIYGPLGHEGVNPIQIMSRNAVAGKPADLSHLWENERGNHLYVRDMATMIVLVHLAKKLKHDIYNVAHNTEHTLLEIAQEVKEVIPEAEIILGKNKTARDIFRGALDITRIQEEFGYIPKYGLKGGVKNLINWYKHSRYGD